MKKILLKGILPVSIAIVFALGLSSCGSADYGETFNSYDAAIDVDYAKEIVETISSFGDDPVMGMRSAGSPAEDQVREYLAEEMEAIGLENVTKDKVTVDNWVFNGANLTFTDADGEEQKIDLGGYQTTLQADNEELELVYVGEGTEDDYEGLDVTDKLVLLEVDQNENWWINYPAYQAKVKGAKACIAMSVYPVEGEDRVGVQDICGPADAPALAISEEDCEALKEAIKAGGGDSVTVTLNCDSTVTEDGESYNLWGEIPGETSETIFVFAHMDGYFHSQYDDAQGVAVSMAIAKGLIDSGYTSDKTIRFCFHCAEEWGRSGSEYDWSMGAYEEIMTTHPEWVEGGFAIINNDGGYNVEGETYAGTRSAVELMSFIEESIGDLNEDSQYEWSYQKTSTYTEDFQWSRVGIPAIVAGSGEGVLYDETGYHSTYDSWDAQPLDEDGLRESIQTYGKLVIDLDAKSIRPMDFTARIQDIEDSLTDASIFEDEFDAAYEAAAALEEKMASIEESGDKDEAVDMNAKTQEVYLAFQDAFLGLNFDPETINKHELYQSNVENLDAAIEALEEGEIQEAYDEYLSCVDWAWYQMYFDEETCSYMENQLFENRDDTWGADLIAYPHADTGDVVRSLKAKYDTEDADVSQEITELKELRDTQQKYLDETLAAEKEGFIKAIELMEEYSN